MERDVPPSWSTKLLERQRNEDPTKGVFVAAAISFGVGLVVLLAALVLP
jgi:hypothetical protein